VILERLRRHLLSRPRLWAVLLLWPMSALAVVLALLSVCRCGSAALNAVLGFVAGSALVCLALLGFVALRLYRGVRELRNRLFQGDYEMALDVAAHNPAVGEALGFEKALRRMLEFDARRGDKVAAGVRLLGSMLQEAPAAFFVIDLEENLVYFSRAARQLFGVNADRFSLMSLLMLPANRDFASLYNAVACGERARADATLTLHLPIRQAARRVSARMLAVQSEEGLVLYVLGLLTPEGQGPGAGAPESGQAAHANSEPQPERNDDGTAQG